MRYVCLLISVVAGALVLARASGAAAPPTAPPARTAPTKEARAELARAQLEQALMRAERTARLLTELERLAPTPDPTDPEAGP